ncbi:MAG: alpha/beta hydrolase [Candidatus Limnocylindrales bacterium]
MHRSQVDSKGSPRRGHGTTSVLSGTVIALVAALSVAGNGLAQSSSAGGGEPTPPPFTAERYDIGGRSLFMICVGPTDSTLPTVIAEAPLGGDSSAFNALGALLAGEDFRSCAYDRSGTGNSDPPPEGVEPGPGPVTLHDVAMDLHALLGAAGIEPPYLLLPHSIGGWAARVFTAAYPDEVAGIVFIDSSHPDQVARHRAILPPVRADEDPGIAFARAGNEALVTTPPGADIGWLDLVIAADEARASGDLGDRPVIVLTADQQLEELPEPYRSRDADAWLAMQEELASLSTRGIQRTVADAGHFIQDDQPEAVIEAIREVQSAIAQGSGE